MKVNELILDLTGEDIQEIKKIIETLKLRDGDHPEIDRIKKEYDPYLHDITSKVKRPDKQVKKEDGQTAVEPVARIALAIQKLIVKRAASFLFGNPVKPFPIDSQLSDTGEIVFDSLKKILRSIKEQSFNKRLARELFKATEVAEMWYTFDAKETHTKYGFPSDLKIKSTIWSPLSGDLLYPIFDDTDDLVAFSREYEIKKGDEKEVYFETYTADEKVVWKKEKEGWVEVNRVDNPIGKIPVVYSRQDNPEWHDVQGLIDRMEKLFSNYADTIDYHASPTIFVNGEITGFAQKGESGKILEADENAKAQYLSWDQAPDAVKLEIETLVRFIYSLTQTPDISFESVKGIGNITGIALKLMFMDAHLKVEDKKEIFVEHLQRRYSLILAYIGTMNGKYKEEANNMEIDPEITPYMIDDQSTLMSNISTALGGKSFMSRKTAIETLGYVDDSEEEIRQINEEELGGMEV
ncbi:phage portal protein [Pleomorphovibrio marinus]|uniref:phage portal protein n=1 Tax=Pleomorphovibrio marinus TaxID=2164132 RepID=UPI000E0B5522|nr:phage portal protein [Pleomorphovibrio marinus]